jgi:multidrug efflux pump subunit AcrA (membrane-fusion protein)
LQTENINLCYTDIVAPIDGKGGKTNVTKGNVVGPESGPLTVIVSQKPMYVTFPVSDRDFLRAQEGHKQVDTSDNKALADGRKYHQDATSSHSPYEPSSPPPHISRCNKRRVNRVVRRWGNSENICSL